MNRKKGSNAAWVRNSLIGRTCLIRAHICSLSNHSNLLTNEELTTLSDILHKLDHIYRNRKSSWEQIKEENKSKQ